MSLLKVHNGLTSSQIVSVDFPRLYIYIYIYIYIHFFLLKQGIFSCTSMQLSPLRRLYIARIRDGRTFRVEPSEKWRKAEERAQDTRWNSGRMLNVKIRKARYIGKARSHVKIANLTVHTHTHIHTRARACTHTHTHTHTECSGANTHSFHRLTSIANTE